MLTSMVDQTMEDNGFNTRLRGNLYEVIGANGGIVPEVLKGRYTSEYDASRAIKLYLAQRILKQLPPRPKAILKDPKRPGRRPEGVKRLKGLEDGSSKDSSTVQ